MIKVLAAVETEEDHTHQLRSILADIDDVSFTEVPSANDALQALESNNQDVAVINFRLPDMGAIELTRRIRESHHQTRVVILTSSDVPGDIFEAMDAGADGYVLMGNLSRSIESAIRSVRLGQVWLDPGIAQQVLAVIETPDLKGKRILPTGLMMLPLLPDEKALLNDVAGSSCVDGVCMVDPDFLRKLRRFAPSPHQLH